MLHTLSELQNFVKYQRVIPHNHTFAVGSLIFTKQDQILMIERGEQARDEPGMLEGVGGSIESTDSDLVGALLREIQEELGNIQVEVTDLFTIMQLPGKNGSFWVIPIYLCRLISGEPQVMEPGKCKRIHYLKLDEISLDSLSTFQQHTMCEYFSKYGTKPFYKV